MTLRNRSLQLRRLTILKSGHALYDERYHTGVNIIRGENSSGKSTIANFIFYVLGGDLHHWTPEASSADSVLAEISIDNTVYTLRREVQAEGHPALEILEDSLEGDVQTRRDWLRYPYARTSKTESLSDVLFRMLGFPKQVTETSQSITMHQVLRLLYCDQLTSVREIFRHDEFDRADFRAAVGELLLGIDDLALHRIRLEIRVRERELSEVSGELRSLFSILGRTGDSSITVQDFQQEIQDTAREQEETTVRIDTLNRQRDRKAQGKAAEKAETLKHELRLLKSDLASAELHAGALTYDIVDSQGFIETIKERIEAIDNSKSMAEILGTAKFDVCPACLTPISDRPSEETCHLCHTPLSKHIPWRGHLKMREELEFQRRESEKLLAEKIEESTKVQYLMIAQRAKIKELFVGIAEFTRELDPIDAEIGLLQKRLGYLEKTQEDLQRKVELSDLVQKRLDHQRLLQDAVTELRLRLEALMSAREKRRIVVQTNIKKNCVQTLHRDLNFEDAFRDALDVEFSFRRNGLSVDGRSAFSASSHTYLKNSFLFALFQLSLSDPEARWPRFLLLDNIEDKGMQPARSANFQEYIVETLSDINIAHQLIFTTSMISPKLEDTDLCVGPHYDERHKTLQFANKIAEILT